MTLAGGVAAGGHASSCGSPARRPCCAPPACCSLACGLPPACLHCSPACRAVCPLPASPAARPQGRFDELVEAQGGVKVLIDPGALMHVLGTKMDWVEDRLR